MAAQPLPSPLATAEQRDVERLALKLIEHSEVRAAREHARALLLSDKTAQTVDGRMGLDRALDQWVMSLVMRVINADPWRPKAIWNVYNPPRHWFGHTYPGAAVAIDNPDNTNRDIPIDGTLAYEIHGRFGNPPTQFTAELVTDFEGYAGVGRTLAALTSQHIVADAKGNFVITVDPREAQGRANHLRSEPGRCYVFTRDSMSDWHQRPTLVSVQRIGGTPPAQRTEARIVEDIVASMPVWVRFWCGFKDDFLGYPAPNTLVGPIGRPGGWGFLVGGRFKLHHDEAVVITTTDGGANYTGIQISDPWTISPDPVTRLGSLNKSQARPNPDGTYTYVISTRDPGVHNWVDTVGLHEGWMLLRWQGVPSTTDTASLVRSVITTPLESLPSMLPTGAPKADLPSRSAQIELRIAQHAARLAE
jgi:hypothetical protein